MEIDTDEGKSLRSLVPALNNLVKQLCEKIDGVNANIDELRTELHANINDVKNVAQEALHIAKDSKLAFDGVQQQLDRMQFQFECVYEENKQLKYDIAYLDNYNRRSNIIVRGIPEKENETESMCEDLMRSFMKNKLGLDDVFIGSTKFVQCHRLGRKPNGGERWVRPIMMRFEKFGAKQTVWNARQKLANSGCIMLEIFSKNTDYNRNKLYPIYKHAKNYPVYAKKVSLKEDNLFVNSVKYNVDNMNNLPGDLHPKHFCSKSNATTEVFGGIMSEAHPFSNWAPSPFNYEGIMYANLEQAYMYHKSVENNDVAAARAIRYTVNPRDIKTRGSSVKVIDQDKWDNMKAGLMVNLVRAKFTQNDNLKKMLMDTKDKQLGETGRDRFFSIGLPLTRKDVLDTSKWTGANHLGLALQTVRDELRG